MKRQKRFDGLQKTLFKRGIAVDKVEVGRRTLETRSNTLLNYFTQAHIVMGLLKAIFPLLLKAASDSGELSSLHCDAKRIISRVPGDSE